METKTNPTQNGKTTIPPVKTEVPKTEAPKVESTVKTESVSTEPAKEVKEVKEKKETSKAGTAVKTVAIKILRLLVANNSLVFKMGSDTKPEEVGELKKGDKVFAAGSVEAQQAATRNFYNSLSGKITKNGTVDKDNEAVKLVKEYIAKTTVKDNTELTKTNQLKEGQSILDALMETYKAERSGSNATKVATILTLDDLFFE